MIGRLEETFLAAIAGLGGESYSFEIGQAVKKHMRKDYSAGTILTTLYRMEEKGFLSSREGEPTPQRGGRRKRYFKIESTGQAVLKEREKALRSMSIGNKG